MFDYTKETILNSVTDKNVQAITGLLRIFRVGEYKVDYKSTNIADGKVYKCNISFESKSGKLKVRGSLDKHGIIGRTQYWTRVK